MDNAQRIAELILKQLKGELDSQDADELNAWISQSGDNKLLHQQLTDPSTLQPEMIEFYQSKKNILSKIQAVTDTARVIPLWKKMVAAASIILALGVGTYFLLFNTIAKKDFVEGQEKRFKNDVNPGGYKAKLTLADGREIVLDSAVIGELAKQGGTVVLNKDGRLVYAGNNKSTDVLYNTLSTAKGETYSTKLSDGTVVWLNSGSSIKYPVAFTGSERRVEITGEAYFSVEHNAGKPFIVSVNPASPSGRAMQVYDLGTEFNINAYSDEAVISTTLVQGSAKVTKAGKEQLLLPGQQVQANISDLKLIANADVVAATAWKNGVFQLNGVSAETLMRQIARWYDVEVVFEGGPVKQVFYGTIPRTVTAANVFKVLEETGGVHFKIEGKKVTVMP